MTNNPIKFTLVTAENCELSKRYERDAQGNVVSTAIAHMTRGNARVMELTDVSELPACLRMLTPYQAITCGVPRVGNTALTTRSGAEFRADVVARTNESFVWHHGPSLFAIDVDIDEAGFQTVRDVLDVLESCHPWLRHVSRVAHPSASSYVDSRGLRGVHVYCAITRGTDIPRLAERMQIEEWAAGRGYVKISRSGALLARQLSDALVYQPSRLMFEAPPVCIGVERNVPQDAWEIRASRPLGAPSRARDERGFLDYDGLLPIKEIEVRRFETRRRQAKDARRHEAKKIAIDYQMENAIASGLDASTGQHLGLMATRALGDKTLPADWTVFIKDTGPVKVSVILANIESALGRQCADPFDTWRQDLLPKHFTKAEIVTMGTTPGVWSHKLQTFFAFTNESAANLSTPLEQAAEKFCGLIEYPDKIGRTAPLANIKFALDILLRDIDLLPKINMATGYAVRDHCPTDAELLDALTRVGCSNVSQNSISTALDLLAQMNVYDPWKESILSLPQWDKVPRLDNFFSQVCGTPESVAATLTAQLLFAGLIMRQLKPGAPMPVVPVLIGAPRFGKSLFVEGLAQAFGAPMPSPIKFTEERTMSMRAARSVVAELAEMSGISKRHTDDVKAWITDTVDVYRRPFDRRECEHPRRFVLIGTANRHHLNRDDTGSRRFMPIDVTCRIASDWVIEVPQLLAEAKQRFCEKEDEYIKLVRATSDAVFDFNQADMLHGVGIPDHTLDDLLPAIVKQMLLNNDSRRLYSSDIRRAIDQHASGRSITSQEISQWLRRRGYERGENSRGRFYVAPVSTGLESDDAGVSDVITGPFTQTNLA